ncbi:MAG: hypothetical protein K0U48_10065 [Actinomycetia bacterium]|mgnify:FL=1|nr:hypothetical protein [Actinomycetes bacterium]
MDVKFQYWLNENRSTSFQFLTWIIALVLWGPGIPLAFGALGGNADVAVGLAVVTSATALVLLIVGTSVVTAYKNITADIPEEALDLAFAQSEKKNPFGFFTAVTILLPVAILAGHLLILF